MALIDVMKEIDTYTLEGLERNQERLQEHLKSITDLEYGLESEAELHYTERAIEVKRLKLKSMW